LFGQRAAISVDARLPSKFSSDWRDGKFVPAAINACPGDAQLVIEAWDQS
jgi:hypothetical protein